MRLLCRYLLSILSICLWAITAAHAQTNLLGNGDFAQGMAGWRTFDKDDAGNVVILPAKAGATGTLGTVALVDAAAGPFKKALRATVQPQPGDSPFAFGLQQPLTGPLQTGVALLLKVWLRSPEAVTTTVMLEQSKDPYTRSFGQEWVLTPQWQEYELQGDSMQDYGPGQAQVTFWLSHAPGTIEIAGVRLLQAKLIPQLDLQVGHIQGVKSVAFSPDGKTVASGSDDSTVKLWDAPTGLLRQTIKAHSGGVSAVAFAPDGRLLASAGGAPWVELWDVETGALRRTLSAGGGWLSAVTFSGDGKTLAAVSSGESIKVWDVTSGALLRTLTAHAGAVTSLAISPDGVSLASGSSDKTICLWDVLAGQVRQTFVGHQAPVSSVAFSTNGQMLASGSEDETARLWNTQTGETLRTFQHVESVGAVALSPDGQTLAAGGGSGRFDWSISLWDAQTGVLRHTLTGHKFYISSLIFAPDGKTLASGGLDSAVKLWDAQTGKEVRELGHATAIYNVAFSPDGRTIAEGGEQSVVHLWNRDTGELKRTLWHATTVNSMAYSPDGKTLAIGSGRTLYLWNPEAGELLHSFVAHEAWWVASLAFSPDSRTLVSSCWDGTIKFWDARTGSLKSKMSMGDNANPVAFSPDGKMLACAVGSKVVVLDIITKTSLHTLVGHTGMIWSVRWSPNGKTIVSAGYDDGTVRLWDAQSGALQRTLQEGPQLDCAVFSPDGKTLMSGTPGRVHVWDVASGTVIRLLTGHHGEVHSLAIAPDGRTVAIADDQAVKLWDIATGRRLATFFALPPQNTVAALSGQPPIAADSHDVTTDCYLVVTPEGYYSGSAVADHYVRFKLGENSFPAECFQARYYRPDLVRQVLAGQEVPPVGDFKGAYPPLVSFASQHDGDTVTGTSAPVTVETSDDSEVRSVVFFVNGARVDDKSISVGDKSIVIGDKSITTGDRALMVGRQPIPAAHTVSRRFTATLPLPVDVSTIKVQAIALDDDGLQSPRAELLLNRDKTAATTTGKLLGLCVGVSHYRDEHLNLTYADQDAFALAADMNQQHGLYNATGVTTLTNDQATAPNVIKALDDLIATTSPADTVVVFLSGHGWRSDTRSFYFATHEVDRNDVAHTALAWSEVVARLTKLSGKSKRVIVLLDACHSGSAATNEELVATLEHAKSGVIIFASSGGSEVSIENTEWAHGAFTKALLEAARGQGAPPEEKNVTTIDIIAYVSRRVKALTKNRQHPQVPFLQDFDTDAPIMAIP